MKQANYHPGDVVLIYQDPLIQRDLEGEARLHHRLPVLSGQHPNLERWMVQFEGEEELYERLINRPTEEKK